jgi:hypothetical protein
MDCDQTVMMGLPPDTSAVFLIAKEKLDEELDGPVVSALGI